MTIIFLQLFATVFMSFGYFIKPEFLKNCDTTFINEIDKSKKRLEKNKELTKKLYQQNKSKINIKIFTLIILFISLYLIFYIKKAEEILSYISTQAGVTLILFFLALIFYLFYLLYKKIEIKWITALQYCFLIFYKILILVSKKGYISGSGLLLLGFSFFLRFLNELDVFNEQTLHVTQSFCMLVIIMSSFVIAIMMDTYSKKIIDIKNQ